MRKSLVIGCNAWYQDEMGGAYRIASEFALYCAGKGWDVHFVSAHGTLSGAIQYRFENGIHLWKYPSPVHSGEKKSLGNLRGHWRGAEKAGERIREKLAGPGSLVLNGHTALQYGGLLKSLGKICDKKVLSVHSPLSDEYLAEKNLKLRGLQENLAFMMLRQIEKKIYKASDLIQCDSKYTQSVLEKEFPDETRKKMTVCPGYVEPGKEPLARLPRPDARRRLDDKRWLGNAVYFFSLRRLVPRTGIDNLVRAAAWLKARPEASGLSFRVMIAGEGPMRAEYEKLKAGLGLEKEVHFLGALPEEKLGLYHRAADCFVLPTRALECFGLVILEAYAAGTPVIATPVGAIPEVMGPFQEGLAKENTPEALGERMLSFLKDSAGRNASQEMSYEKYAMGYEKNKILSQLESCMTGGR